MKPSILVVMLTLAGLASPVAAAATMSTSRATFVVHCYSVGEHALSGQPGVVSVEPGWRNFREVDRVEFDPEQISVEQMEELLRRADTYVDTVEVINKATGTGEAK